MIKISLKTSHDAKVGQNRAVIRSIKTMRVACKLVERIAKIRGSNFVHFWPVAEIWRQWDCYSNLNPVARPPTFEFLAVTPL